MNFNWQSAWNVATSTASNQLKNPLGAFVPAVSLWNTATAAVDVGFTHYDKKIRAEQTKFNCKAEEIELSPNADETFVGFASKQLRTGIKTSICKHIEQSNDHKIYEALKATRDIMKQAPVLVGVATYKFVTGSVAAILPENLRGHFLKAVEWVNTEVYQLLNFDIQQSDAVLDRQSLNFVGLAGQTGEVLGKAIGWASCGLSANAGVAVINKAQAAKIFAEVGKEFADEIAGELWALVQSSTRKLKQMSFNRIFMNVRRWLKDPKSPFYPLLVKQFGQKTIDQWGNPNNKPWSINNAVEEWSESFKDLNLQSFLEEAWEGLTEGCQESFIAFTGAFSEDLVKPALRRVSINSSISAFAPTLGR